MKKILILIVLLLTIVTTPKTYAQIPRATQDSARLTTQLKRSSYTQDARVIALENVFKKYNSPLEGQAEHYVYYADKYGIDWRLLPAISGLESTFARFMMPGSHNAYGWGGGHIYFESWQDGINQISESLRKKYYDRGADTIYKIGPIYAQSPTWSQRVTYFAAEISNEYVSVQADTLTPTI